MKEKIKFKLVAIILTISLFSFVFPNKASADHWGAAMLAATWARTMKLIDEAIHGVIIGALKQAALETITSTVNNIISGGSGGGVLFITNWEDYLVRQPRRDTELYMNDLFTITMRGTGSTVNYAARSAGGTPVNSINQEFEAYKRGAFGNIEPYNLTSYCDDPSTMYADNTWSCYKAYWSNPMNSTFGREAVVWTPALLAKQNEAERIAQTKAASYQGFLPQEKNGQVITPGSTIASIQAGVENLGKDIVANAENAPEIISSLVVSLTTKTILQGIGNAQRQVQREIDNSISSARRDINQSVNISGPGSVFQSKY
jgi:hypothetical protein